jgi:delta 1-pyrroline-5-carboxylate dehydrogenase
MVPTGLLIGGEWGPADNGEGAAGLGRRGHAARSCAAATSCCSRQEELALLMTLEMGKPLAEACGEIAYAAEFFRWFSEEAVRIDGGYAVAPNGQGRLLVMRQPVGPSLLITPWNFPMAMGTRKIGPAVAPGCTMVVKPAEQTANEMVARYRVRTRRWIGSAALVADGLHAFADGFASLTVVLSAAAAWRAFRLPTR